MPKKKNIERKHMAQAQLSNVELVKVKSSLQLDVYANKEKIGQLDIGRGSLYWWGRTERPANGSVGQDSQT